jgi:hypothetical protein
VAAFEYAAKFVCGKPGADELAPGVYFTAINVHNPTERDVKLRKKIAIAGRREEPGPVSEFFDARLGPDQALEIDCPSRRPASGKQGRPTRPRRSAASAARTRLRGGSGRWSSTRRRRRSPGFGP